ncbi:NaeI family type II restriction endonuclease [Streptomyces sp. LP05-1]|uniref:NaeI family type II restriction endonuclease n=1 Tax=Streptomyces pyxinae TaxID=2970734 RepID=A0ABT2CB47_9ACTN|nr:NaeI family type II restriction endonuclease [Streptomyces sp. LP05-1]MCS0634640.1 NaeI family type II restriction endonuclease [Streptomyces sp. LP05-1]
MTLFDSQDLFQTDHGDPQVQLVRQYFMTKDPDGSRFAQILRRTIDQLLDGENTGRYDWNDLHKTEKTHAGTLVEINLLREFGLASGDDLDYLIEGIEVDCKFSQTEYGWMIPPEALGEICLVVWADDHKKIWSAGLLRADKQKLTMSGKVTKRGNRDGKFRLTRQHHTMVTWIWYRQPLKENLLLHLDSERRTEILSKPSGQQRVNELFRKVLQKRIDRNVIRTLAQQSDYMARVRDDGGRSRARPALRPEGIIITGEAASHRAVAQALGGPVPQRGEFVSFRVAPALPEGETRPAAEIGGSLWVAVECTEPTPAAAPVLPPR